ncbi:MAG TPA: hypothetical protein DCX21_02225 [Eubacterium sp.]|nr:hypothetical protein [Eubacterium sp.]HBZ52484.1 hypothetical protein [Eubacterium sp.]
MRNLFLKNIGLKLLALLLAVFIWMAIVNINDPSERKTISNIPVTVYNTEVFTDKGYMYSIVDDTNVISVEVKGPRSVVEKLKASDFVAKATIPNEFSTSAKIDVDCKKSFSGINVSVTPQISEVKFDVQNLITKTHDITVELKGDTAEGYYTDSSLVSISPSTIKISGPEKIVDSIKEVKMIYDVTGENTSITASVTPVFLDADGNVVKKNNLTLSRDTITVRIDMYKVKTVPVKFAYTGVVKDGYKLKTFKSDIDKVRIAGTATELAKITSVDIPATLIDITDLTGAKTYEVNVSQYIPTTVIAVDEKNVANVDVDVEKLKTRNIFVTNSDIKLEGLNTLYNANIKSDGFYLTIRGPEEDVDKVKLSDLSPTINMIGLSSGDYNLSITFNTGNLIEVVGTYKANVSIVSSGTVNDEE